DGEALSVLARASKKNDILIPHRITLRIVAQACMGLHAAHELRDENDQLYGVVHRDVSPQNVLVTYDGHVKLVDFGVAKATNRASGETTAGQLKGKIPYMSPEQARGGQVDRRTDIFAMGIVLYRLATGVHPFAGDTDLVTMQNIIAKPVLPPRARNPKFPADLEQVLLKCLHKDADKRYQTMIELERAVQEVLAKEPPVTSDDIGNFIRTLMGDRGQKRRAQLRDAVRLLDERASTPIIDTPLVHEGVSGLVLTQMRSGVGRDLVPTRAGTPQALAEELPNSAVLSSPAHELALPAELPAGRRRSGIALAAAVGLVAALGVGGLILLFARGRSADAPAAPLEQPSPVAADTATAAPTATATAAPTPSSSAALDVNSLPDQDDQDPKNGSGPQAKSGGPGGKATAAPSGSASTKPSKWVPTVTNPGF
ncbi:MAG: serine/threonine protein kinase, partial [Polyangiaceae bacterium]|nr:serine/threonine protein kinase [Polyangiaceae bacterium]